MPRTSRAPAAQGGFTLLEILVALIIISVGLLGLAGAQVFSLQSSQASYERSIAVMQSRDLVERLWAGICDVYDNDGEDLRNGNNNAILTAWKNDHNGALGRLEDDSWNGEITNVTGRVLTIEITWSSRLRDADDKIVREQFVHSVRIPDFSDAVACTQ